jgi:hypothetical protein
MIKTTVRAWHRRISAKSAPSNAPSSYTPGEMLATRRGQAKIDASRTNPTLWIALRTMDSVHVAH